MYYAYVFTYILSTGPTSRFTRVCDKLHNAISNPHKVSKPMSGEFIDHDNPSGSSDDTLTIASSRNGNVSIDSRQSSSVSIEVVDHDDDTSYTGHPSLLQNDSSDSEDGLVDT